MNPKSQNRAVLVLRMNHWNDEDAARTREALSAKLVAHGVAPDAIEVQEWHGLNGFETMPKLEQLEGRVRAGEIRYVAVRDLTRLGRFADPTFTWPLTQALACAGGALVTLHGDYRLDESTVWLLPEELAEELADLKARIRRQRIKDGQERARARRAATTG